MTTTDDRLAMLGRLPGEVLCVLGVDGSLRYVSPSVERVLGYPPDTYRALDRAELIHPDDREAAATHWAAVVTGPGAEVRWELRMRDAAGRWRWIEVAATNTSDQPGLGAVVASFRDMADRRATEQRLREAQARLQAVVDTSQDVVGILDPEGRLSWINAATTTLLGAAPEELLGTSAFDLVHPDDLEPALLRFQEALVDVERTDPVGLRLRHARGDWVPVEVVGTAWRSGRGLEGVVINVRDLTWRRQVEQDRLRAEERFRALVQNSHDAVLVLDDRFRTTWVSPSLEQMLGRPETESLGTTGLEWVHPDDVDRVAAALAAIDRPGTHTAVEVRVQHADGSYRWLDAVAVNLLDNPAVEGLVINVRDITDRREAEDALRSSELLFRSLTSSAPVGVFRQNVHGECTYVNPKWRDITGYAEHDALGHGWRRIVHPEDRARLGMDGRGADDTPSAPATVEFRVVRPDGDVRWVFVRTAPIFDDDGGFAGNVGVMVDVTERVAAQRDTQRLTDIFEATSDLVAIADATGGISYLNRSARSFFDLPPDAPLHSFDLVAYLPTDAADRLATDLQPQLDREDAWQGELPLVRPDGQVVPHLAQVLVHRGDDGRAEFYSAVLHDISERKAFEHRLAHQATHDPLTGLPNRMLLLDRLSVALARIRRLRRGLAVLFVDLDHFKVVNDSLGHSQGDRLLVAIASRLETALRPGDTIARFGGDEFVVLCEDLAEPEAATEIADRLGDVVREPFTVGDAEVFVGLSIGITFTAAPEADPETIIADADAAMYQAKARGRGRWVLFDHAMRAHAVERLDIENALRRALERRELRVHYQPVADLRTGAVCGVEALLRWEHPERGLLGPADFIGMAEDTGLIVPIGLWVLDHACRQVQRWRAAGEGLEELVVAVNLSGRQLGDPTLVTDVAAVLDATGIDPAHVELEITESVLMDDVELAEETLGELKALGVQLVVDDFGTGYSSLSYLRRFPVDQLKIDRSFVAGLESDPTDAAIVRAILTLAHHLGLEAVAEGVERPEQLEALQAMGCDKAQGFHLARPMPGDAVHDLLLSPSPSFRR